MERRTYEHITVEPMAGSLGAEISGLDLAIPLLPEIVSEINNAFLDHLVIVFRDQNLTPPQLLAFAQQLGDPMEYPQTKGLPECPLVTPVVKLENETVNFGGVWHSDTAYLPQPPMASMLYAIEVPPSGGDTLFANQYLAYETLSKGLKETLEDLVGVNTSANPDMARTRQHRQAEDGLSLKFLEAAHPAIRTHPETGRRALYVNTAHTSHFEGWSEAESRPLLDYLAAHQIQPEFTCRLRWELRTLALWDNRCTQHYPVNDYHGHRRIMHRITLAGDVPIPLTDSCLSTCLLIDCRDDPLAIPDRTTFTSAAGPSS
jgi:taurine dioxygenase